MLSLQQSAQLATMKNFLVQCRENGYGNVREGIRANYDVFVDDLLAMDCNNEEDFNRFCGQFRTIMEGIQMFNPNLVIPQLFQWNEFNPNTLP
ncbi:unnamed protein product [Caenorhabditis angaria]|uniref:Uncharacterized protein n=1 Tax=Caenorhabditis angaria TaxID=860376 RepID=A0A9P1J627_9PELO|nr:unnamed protein product [Caenorhabditis angaria]